MAPNLKLAVTSDDQVKRSNCFFVAGMTPLLAAAVTGHIHIVEFLIGNRNLVSRQERIDSLELLGATFVDKKRDMLGCYKLWKRAMEERYEKRY